MWAIEGTGSYGCGFTTDLLEHNEWVVEIDRPARPAGRNGAKSDDLDAIRAAREALSREHLAAPRARGDREALRVLMAARQGAVVARTKAIGQLKAQIVSAPQALRDQLRRGTTDQQLQRCARLPGIGAITAAQFIVSWSHAGRIRSEAAFASLGGVAPIPASSGTVTRHRLNRSGDRQLNRALHTVALTRLKIHERTKAYAARRTSEGKSAREIKRCLKRAIAREVYRMLEAHAAAQSASIQLTA